MFVSCVLVAVTSDRLQGAADPPSDPGLADLTQSTPTVAAFVLELQPAGGEEDNRTDRLSQLTPEDWTIIRNQEIKDKIPGDQSHFGFEHFSA